MRPLTLFTALGVACLLPSIASAAVEIKQEADKVSIAVGGQPLTELRFTGSSHVYFYPVFGPGGARMTRSWPMEEAPNEEHDHPHHRSLWFAHGDVNGVDFWTEATTHGKKPAKMPVGKIEHEKFITAQGGEKEGVLTTANKWIAPDGSVPLTDTQTLRVYETGTDERQFDFEIVLKAGDKDVKMGDTKEGTMAIRIAESMRLKGGKGQPSEGHILNDSGITDKDAWGKKAAWVDYSGPVDGKTVGIAIFDHPKNPRHPTRWHARDYGLFAANPFCEHDMDKSSPEGAGAVTIPAGQSLTLRYRFLLHSGDAAQAKVAEQFAEYAKSAK